MTGRAAAGAAATATAVVALRRWWARRLEGELTGDPAGVLPGAVTAALHDLLARVGDTTDRRRASCSAG